MAHDGGVAVAVGQIDRVQRFRQRTDLVHFHENGVGGLGVDALLEELGVRDEEVISDELRRGTEGVGEVLPAGPIVFGAAVFDRDDREFLLQLGIVGHQLLCGALRLVALLEDVLAFGFVVELRRSDVEGNEDVFPHLVASFVDGLGDDFQRVVSALQCGSKTPFVTDSGVQPEVVKDLLEGVKHFRPVAQSFREARSALRHDHELLEVNRSIRVGSAVDDVHHRHRQHFSVGAAEVFVKGLTQSGRGGFGHGQRSTEDRIGTQFRFGGRAVDFQHRLVDGDLIRCHATDDAIGDFIIHGINGFQHAFAEVTLLVAIAKFQSFMFASAGTAGNRSAAQGSVFQEHVHFDGRVAAGVEHFAPDNLYNGEFVHEGIDFSMLNEGFVGKQASWDIPRHRKRLWEYPESALAQGRRRTDPAFATSCSRPAISIFRNQQRRGGFKKARLLRFLDRSLFRSIFPPKTMIVRAALSASALLLGLLSSAQSQPPGPPKPMSEGRANELGRRHAGEWRGFGSPGIGRTSLRSQEYEKLPEEERKQIREALDRVWSRPEVMQAREKAMKAHGELRQAIRQELQKIDPKAAAILAKIEPQPRAEAGDWAAPLPALDSEDYPRQMLARFGREMIAFSKPERQEDAKRFHERISAMPTVQEAVKQAQALRGEERIQAIQKLRLLYRETVVREFQALKERRPSPQETEKALPPKP